MTPTWLDKLEKKIGWLALPNLAIFLIILQLFGILSAYINPEIFLKFALVPQAVLKGEIWRLLTFLAVPLSYSPSIMGMIWTFFFLLILYYAVNSLEAQWGAFKVTFYLLISLVLTLVFSFITGATIPNFQFIFWSLLLALTTLFPEHQLYIYMIFPVKLKWFGILIGGFILYQFFMAGTLMKIYLLAVYTNYILFFGPSFFNRIKQFKRKRDFNRKKDE